MIHSIRIQNYQSINEEVVLNFVVSDNAPKTSKYVKDESGTRITLVQTLIGANASGKTSILRAIPLLKWLLVDSFESGFSLRNRYKPFAGAKKNQPTSLAVAFEVDGSIYEYETQLLDGRIISEHLATKTRAKIRTTTKMLFSRVWDKKSNKYIVHSKRGFVRTPFANMSESDLACASFIAIAGRYGDAIPKQLLSYWRSFQTNIEVSQELMPLGYHTYVALSRLSKDPEAMKPFERYDFSIEKYNSENGSPGTFTHSYKGKSFDIEVDEESSGTKQFIILLEKLGNVLKYGGVGVIDEADAYLHSFLLNELVSQFFDPAKNPHKAQLLMSTHSHQVLANLDKYQIVITEKTDGETRAIRLDEISGVRSDDNYFAKYMASKYGGVPYIK